MNLERLFSIKISPHIEILYDDLINQDIDCFLNSREFKILLYKNDFVGYWNSLLEMVDRERPFISTVLDNDELNREDALKIILNGCEESIEKQNFITNLILEFINTKKHIENFSHIIESVKISNFSIENVIKIENISKKFLSQDLINKELKTVKKNEINIEVDKTKVFIVHGHNKELELDTARTLEKLGLEVVILHEKANNGQTIIEKIEKNSDVSYAIVLLTADDLGKAKNEKSLNTRARQNVILELGLFIGKLGRKNVMALCEKGIEHPSDFSGVVYTDYDKAGKWKSDLVKELKFAGFDVDANKIL